MLKNNVFNDNVDTKKWFINAGIRAIKTFAQTAVSLITVGQAITDLDWIAILSISATSTVISLLTSLGGIPEVPAE
jgi:hypothetical protein